MKYPRIHRARVIDDVTLIVEFTNCGVKKYSILHLLSNPMFSPLRQPAFFRSFEIEQDGYGIAWNEEMDIGKYELWKNGVTLEDKDSSLSDILNRMTVQRQSGESPHSKDEGER